MSEKIFAKMIIDTGFFKLLNHVKIKTLTPFKCPLVYCTRKFDLFIVLDPKEGT